MAEPDPTISIDYDPTAKTYTFTATPPPVDGVLHVHALGMLELRGGGNLTSSVTVSVDPAPAFAGAKTIELGKGGSQTLQLHAIGRVTLRASGAQASGAPPSFHLAPVFVLDLSKEPSIDVHAGAIVQVRGTKPGTKVSATFQGELTAVTTNANGAAALSIPETLSWLVEGTADANDEVPIKGTINISTVKAPVRVSAAEAPSKG